MKTRNILVIAIVLLGIVAIAGSVNANITAKSILPKPMPNLIPTKGPISATGVWMSVTYPTNYVSYAGTKINFTQYIPIKVEVMDNKLNPSKGTKIILRANTCDSSIITNCKGYTQVKSTNTQGVAEFIYILPYLVNNVDLTVDAYNSAGVNVANFGQNINNIGD
jgi:hypothetical protein